MSLNPAPGRVVLDTNLLLVWLVARTDEDLFQIYKRVKGFTREDARLLQELVTPFRQILTTPHILSETSNFIDQAPSWRRSALVDQFKRFIVETAEIYRPAELLIDREEFNSLGLADTALAELSTSALVITMDYRLSGKIEAMGGKALNFNHYRAGTLPIESPS